MNGAPETQPEQMDRQGIMPFYVLLWLMIGLGIFFRFYNLDHHAYWHDEAITSLHIGGHAKWQIEEAMDKHVLTFDQLRAYTTPQSLPQSWKWWSEEQPEKAPLFYILEYFFAAAFGTTVATMRLLPALLSLLQLPAFYWLGMELFGKKQTALLMVALVSLSPFALIHAQEAREYGFFLALVAAVSAAYLRAYRLNDLKSWCIYTSLLCISLYTSLMTLLVFFAHASHLLLRRNEHQGSGRFKQMGIATLVSAVAFTPWILVNMGALSKGYSTQWMSQKPPNMWIWFLCMFEGVESIFLRLEMIPHAFSTFVTFFCCAIIAFFATRLGPILRQRGPMLLPLLFIVSSLPIILPDILSGGIRATIHKYFSHVAVVCIAITAFAIIDWVEQSNAKKQALGWFSALLILGAQTFSCLEYSKATDTFTKTMAHKRTALDGPDPNSEFIVYELLAPVGQFLEQHPDVLIVSDRGTQYTNFMQLLALAIQRHTKTRVLYFINSDISIADYPEIGKSCYLLNPSETLRTVFEKAGFALQPVTGMSYFLEATIKDVPSKPKTESSDWY